MVFIAPLAFLLLIVPGLFAAGVVHPKAPKATPPIAGNGVLPSNPSPFVPGQPEPPAPGSNPPGPNLPAPAPGAPGAPAVPVALTGVTQPAASAPAAGLETATRRHNRGRHLGQIKHGQAPEGQGSS